MNSESHLVTDVFTPTTPARLTFVERSHVNNRLVDALRTPGKQLIVYGHSGGGKTTLLVNKLDQVYERHVTTRCVVGMTFEQILADGFLQMNAFYDAERSGIHSRSVELGLEADYAALKGRLSYVHGSTDSTVARPVAPPSLTPQALAKFMGVGNYCWILEDFHKVEPSVKRQLAQTMKVFMDMADEYRQLRIVALGAVDTARQVVEYDQEMRNRVSEVLVPLMEHKELLAIIEKGESLLNITIPEVIKTSVVSYSNGLASVCHQLCLNICNAAHLVETSANNIEIPEDVLEPAVEAYMHDASDTFKAAFDKARRVRKKSKYDNVNLIFRALVELPLSGASANEIREKIVQWEPNFPDSNLRHFLSKLQLAERGAVLRFDSASGRYSFSDPVYKVFATTLFKQASDFKPMKAESFEVNWEKLVAEASKTLSSALIRRHLQKYKETQDDLQIDLIFEIDGTPKR